jgi:hypothetical protein
MAAAPESELTRSFIFRFFLQVMMSQARASALPSPEALKKMLPVQAPDFGSSLKDKDGVVVTWLG